MAVGNSPSTGLINSTLGSLAIQMRVLFEAVNDQFLYLENLGASGLETVGFDSSDASTVLTMISYMSTLAGCYYGTVQQGGSGGTGATEFNFNSALSALWGGS